LVCNGADAGNAVLELPPEGPPTTLWTPGADLVKAGAGTIAAGLTNVGTRLRNDATPQPYTEIATLLPLDVDRVTGTALLYNQQLGTGFGLCYPTNPGTEPFPWIDTGPLYSARIIGGIVCWAQGTAAGISAAGFNLNIGEPVPIETWVTNIQDPLLLPNVRSSGDTWIVYCDRETGTLYAHPASDKNWGFSLPAGLYFGLDAEVGAGLLVASCVNQGESAGSLRTDLFDLQRLQLLRAPVVAPTLPKMQHAVSTGVFFPSRE